MEFREYWNIARKRGWIIILVAVVAAVAALGVSLILPETYKATIQLSVNPARADWGLNQATQDLLRNYVLNIKSHTMTQKAIDRAQLDMSTYDFLADLDVSADSSNLSITIQAESRDPEEARLMAQTLAEVFVEERAQWNAEQDKRDRIYVTMVDDIRDVPLAVAQVEVQHGGRGRLWGHRRRRHCLFPGMAAIGHPAHARRRQKGRRRGGARLHPGQRPAGDRGPAQVGLARLD